MTKGIRTCAICGRDFALIVEDHYVARNPQMVGALANMVSTDKAFEFDAFDCPHCGCQNVIQERKPLHSGEAEADAESGSCATCKYADKREDEEPCVRCECNYMNRYEEEDDE